MNSKKLELDKLRKRLAQADTEFTQAHRKSDHDLVRVRNEIKLLRKAIRELERDLESEKKQPWWVTMWKGKK